MSWWHDKQVGMSMDDLYAGGDEGKYEGLNLNLMRQNIAKQDRGSLVSWAKTKRGIEVFNGESYWMRGGENPVEFIVITAEVNGIDLTAITKHLESDLHIKQINNTEEIVALLPSDFKIFGFYDPMSDREWFKPNGKPM